MWCDSFYTVTITTYNRSVNDYGYRLDEGDILIEGYAVVFNQPDREHDRFESSALDDALRRFKERGYLGISHHHKTSVALGSVLEMHKTPRGVYIVGRIDKQVSSSPWYSHYEAIRRGGVRGLSIGAGKKFVRERLPDGTRSIAHVEDLIEISVTATPVSPDTHFSVVPWSASEPGEMERLRRKVGRHALEIKLDDAARRAALKDELMAPVRAAVLS